MAISFLIKLEILPLHYYEHYKPKRAARTSFCFCSHDPLMLPQLTPDKQGEQCLLTLTSAANPVPTIPDRDSFLFLKRNAYFFSALYLFLIASL